LLIAGEVGKGGGEAVDDNTDIVQRRYDIETDDRLVEFRFHVGVTKSIEARGSRYSVGDLSE
jgi:hypothetical protein